MEIHQQNHENINTLYYIITINSAIINQFNDHTANSTKIKFKIKTGRSWLYMYVLHVPKLQQSYIGNSKNQRQALDFKLCAMAKTVWGEPRSLPLKHVHLEYFAPILFLIRIMYIYLGVLAFGADGYHCVKSLPIP